MGHSRITLATLLALGFLATVQAEETAREPFFVELKGPDEPASPAVTSQPLAQPAARSQPGTRAEPLVRQGSVSNARRYGPIHPSDTLWSLASKYRPSKRVSVYQTMVAIYEKNPRSFADGNINHILVGSHILLPSAAEARVITDSQARQRFNSDNASWKGLSPKYLASKPHSQPRKAQVAKPVPPKVAASKSAPIPAAAPATPLAAPALTAKVPSTSEQSQVAKVAEPSVSQATSSSAASATAPAPLPADLGKPAGLPATEMALALEDANAQLGQVTEMNHRLKLRLQALTEEVAVLKAQQLDQTALQKQIAELKARPVPPVVVPAEPAQNWLMDLLASPLNLAMIILLPVLLVLALVTLWLRARARRELEEQEKSLSESTAMVMGEENSEFDELMTLDIRGEEGQIRPVPDLNTPDGYMAMDGPVEPDEVVFSDDGEMDLASFETALAAQSASRDPDLVPDLDLANGEPIALPLEPDLDLAAEFNPSASNEIMSEEELQAALFAELDADLALDADDDGQPDKAPVSDEMLASFDLSDLETALPANPASPQPDGGAEPEWDPSELALSDFEDAFAEVDAQSSELQPRAQADASGYVEIDKLLADADASTTEQEPYEGFALDVGLAGFPEVLPEATGFDVDADDGGVGAKLDLARAYLEIEDKESARELLEEALAQGSEQQRTEAGKLLKRLG